MKVKSRNIFSLLTALSLFSGAFLIGCSEQNNSQAKLDANAPVIAMADLVKQSENYNGKTITVTGRFGGMCSDGADFYFKDKLDLIEVIPPESGMPSDIIMGTPLKIQGVVMLRGEHEEEEKETHNKQQEHEEGDIEPEVKIIATVIQTNRR